MSKMLRIDAETYEKIIAIQSLLGSTKQAVVQKAIDRLNKDLLLAKTDEAFKKLKRDKKSWKQEQKERNEWDFLDDEIDDE